MKPVIIDTDPGTDDAIAIAMALNSPELELLGMTTVGGNARLRHTIINALRLLETLGRPDIPVAQSAARPLRGRAYRYAYDYHGPAGLTCTFPSPRAGQLKPRQWTSSSGWLVSARARCLSSHPGRSRYEICDPLAVAAMLEPGLLHRQARTVRVETRRGERHGQTRILPDAGAVQVSVSVEAERALDICLRLLLRRTATE